MKVNLIKILDLKLPVYRKSRGERNTINNTTGTKSAQSELRKLYRTNGLVTLTDKWHF